MQTRVAAPSPVPAPGPQDLFGRYRLSIHPPLMKAATLWAEKVMGT